jgi:cellulose synthase operon protein B
MRTPLRIALATLILAAPAAGEAQDAHFDMSPEAALAMPRPVVPETTPEIAPPQPDFIRYVVPVAGLSLEGENDRADFQFYLTAAQAVAPATFQLAYLNALAIAPENSRLQVVVNGTTLLGTPIASSSDTQVLTVEVPQNALRKGFNTLSITADQRHRTDCSIDSTYELWTSIDQTRTFLAMSGPNLDAIDRLDDIPAVGVNARGETVVRLVMPERDGALVGPVAFDLVQALALDLRVANPRVEFSDEMADPSAPGTLNVLVATASNLPEAFGGLVDDARKGPIATFVPATNGGSVLVVSGPTWDAIDRAVESIGTVEAQYPSEPGTLPARADRARPIPILADGGTIDLETIGLDTVSFNGRRYRSTFDFALPSDFYADKYGFAQLMLNAAYSGDVMPGSQIDVYVNGEIASVTPVLRTDDATLRDVRIKVPMAAFRPGVNTVEMVASLRTEADALCAPGTVTVGTEGRFLISGESEFIVPKFAKIGQVPNLAAFASSGYPYAGAASSMVIGSGDQALSAALTVAARLAVASGNPLSFAEVSHGSPSPDSNAIFVGAYNQLPPDAVMRVGIAQPYLTGDDLAEDPVTDVESTLERWRSSGSSSSTIIGRVQHWVADLLNLGPNSLGLFPPADVPFAPTRLDMATVVQTRQAEGGVWTMVTVPEDDQLYWSVANITAAEHLREFDGRVSAMAPGDTEMRTVEANDVSLVPSVPLDFNNFRAIAANWLSSHVLAYAIGLALVGIALAISTVGLVRLLGRRSSQQSQ